MARPSSIDRRFASILPCVLAAGLAFGATCVVAAPPDGRGARAGATYAVELPPRADAQHPGEDVQDAGAELAPEDSPLPAGKPGAGQYTLDPRRVTESVQADGTLIIALNGEGMEKMSLTDAGGRATLHCGSPLESRVRAGVPVDFRMRTGSRGDVAIR